MTTRREILTGLAALPLGAATGSAAEAAAAPEPAPRPQFWHNTDAQLWRELELLETALGRVKDRLKAANSLNPMIRSSVLLDMRCSFQNLTMAADWSKMSVDAQRVQADRAAREWKSKRGPAKS